MAQSTRLEDSCSAPDSEEVEEEADPLVQVEDPEPGSAATIWLVCDLGPHAELEECKAEAERAHCPARAREKESTGLLAFMEPPRRGGDWPAAVVPRRSDP